MGTAAAVGDAPGRRVSWVQLRVEGWITHEKRNARSMAHPTITPSATHRPQSYQFEEQS
jgi:hypothetical protein